MLAFPFDTQIAQERLRKLTLERSIVFGQETLPDLDSPRTHNHLPQRADDHDEAESCGGAGVRMFYFPAACHENIDQVFKRLRLELRGFLPERGALVVLQELSHRAQQAGIDTVADHEAVDDLLCQCGKRNLGSSLNGE